MTTPPLDRWRQIEALFHEAQARAPEERAAYLASRCGGDSELRREVESLLAQQTAPGLDDVAVRTPGSPATGGGALVGRRIGAYQILGPLGAGGMGEVYRARDATLGREVAIKILPTVFAGNPERVARLEREARMLAALSHPNIAAIFGAEDVGGTPALILELVDGVTLAERIAQGPVPLAETLAIVRQIADALAAAHDKGIIHRDLKPANVKIAPNGLVKVLDFGLATVHVAGSDSRTEVPTVAELTREGVMMGTTAYMSPEQVRGIGVDKRTDIWAFGCVLYEMLAGTTAFGAETPSDAIATIMKGEPNWSLLPPDTPGSIRTLLRWCLQKDPAQRLRDIADARLRLEEITHERTITEAQSTGLKHREQSRWALAWLATLIVAGAAAVAVSLLLRRPAPDPVEGRFEIDVPSTTEPTSIALSPDGKLLAFVATTDGQSRLFLRPLNAVSAKPLAGTENARLPFWSPDSRSIGFAADEQLKRVDIESGVVRVLSSGGALGAAWNRDGTILFDRVPGPGLWRVSAEGGEPRQVLQGTVEANDQWSPQFLPDHRRYLFYATGTAPGIYGANLDTSESPRRIVDAQSAAYASSGHLLFVRNGTLFAQAFDPVRLVPAGIAVVVAEHVVEGGGRVGVTAALSASAAGSFVYRTGPSTAQNHFVWFDRSGRPQEAVPGPEDFDATGASLSQDGSRLALPRRDATSTTDIWVLDVKRGVPTRLTFDPATDLGPVWSPDGDRIAFISNRRGRSEWALYMKSADATGKDELLVAGLGSGRPNDWSRDGRFILYQTGRGPGAGWDIQALPLEGDRKPVPVVATSFNEQNAQFSPDGRWIAFESDESGSPEIYVQPFPRAGAKVPISTAGGTNARWGREGTELFYVAPDQRLMTVPIQLDAELPRAVKVGTPAALFKKSLTGNYTVSRDGQRFLMAARKEATIPITIVLNWKPKS